MTKLNCIGIIAPASACPEEEQELYHKGINFLKDLGLKVKLAKNIFDRDDSYSDAQVGTAGSIEIRTEELHRIWSDKDVDAIIAIRGGYGCIQLLEQIDYEFIKNNPKPFMGYSDLTALHLAFYQKSQLKTYHTPMISEVHKWHEVTRNSFLNLLNLLSESASELPEANLASEEFSADAELLNFNNSDKVLGGNLSVICSLIGTEYLPSFRDSVLLLEDCNEAKYKIDRMLYQMKYAGLFKGIKALWIGEPFMADFPSATLESIAIDEGFKITKDLPIGHGEINLSIPLG